MPGQPERAVPEPIERASEDELRALQLARLQHILHYTYERVAPYRVKCERAGVHPQDLRTLADLRHFPFTVKDDLREYECEQNNHDSADDEGRPGLKVN